MGRSDKKRKARLEIRLNTKRYDAFVAMLDAPARARPRLEKLLTTPSVLARRGR
jgi:uncharacterized protein (DUF1778 family)